MTRTAKIVLGLGLGFATVVAVMAAVGAATTTHVMTVSRTTTASPHAIWDLWADVPNRRHWDEGLEWARLDAPFQTGATGEVKLRDQPTRKFQVVESDPPNRYTDRFFLPLGTTMDWHHSVMERDDHQRLVTFRVVMTGPTTVVLAPVVRRILGGELPQTVDRLVELAEHQDRHDT